VIIVKTAISSNKPIIGIISGIKSTGIRK